MARIRRSLAIVLAIAIFLQILSGCSGKPGVADDGVIEQSAIYQEFIEQHHIDERYIQQEYIRQNLILEESIYEIVLCEQFICQSYIIETVITENSIEDIAAQLPSEMADYSIDWQKVISQFAAGTAVIIVVGIVYHETKGQSYFLFGSPADIAAEAIIGGAIDATIAVMLNCDGEDVPNEKVAKYAIEGFAEGYMYGAISGVVERIVKPNYLKSPTLGKLKIDNWGNVTNEAGEQIGKALFNTAEKTFSLIDDAGNTLGKFDKGGKFIAEVVSEALDPDNGSSISQVAREALTPNSSFVTGFGDDAVECFTDALGTIYRKGNDLLPNITYVLDGVKYQTDELGRIVSVTFEKLALKPEGQARKSLAHITIEALGKGYEVAGDQKGHIIGDRFRGANSIANLVPMSPQLNQRDYLAIENIWAEAIKNGQIVDGTIKFLYDGVSFRPSRMDITYLIDGIETFARLFN